MAMISKQIRLIVATAFNTALRVQNPICGKQIEDVNERSKTSNVEAFREIEIVNGT